MQRRSLLFTICAVAVLSALAGWVAGRALASPEDARFDAQAPEASLIAVPVEVQELSSRVVVRGDIRFSGSTDVTLASGVGGGGTPVVTGAVPEVGAELSEGDVMLEVSERPVIVLEGELPMFRTLGPGMTGDDVMQFEEALDRLGHDPGAVDGRYDIGTESAVERLYAASGYSPVELSDAEQARLDTAEAAVDAARDSVRQSQLSLQEAQEPLPDSTRLGLDAQVGLAEQALEDGLQRAAEAEKALADEIIAARNSRKLADSALTTATQRLAAAEGGTHPDTNAPPSTAELAELRQDKTDAEKLRDDAAALVTKLQADLEDLIDDNRINLYNNELTNLAIARANRSESLAPADVQGQRDAAADASESLSDAQVDLAEAQEELGVRAPITEIMFLDVLPRRIDLVNIGRGDVISGSVATVSGVDLLIDSAVAAADRPLISVGMSVVIDEASLGIELNGTIEFVADSPGTNDVSESRYYLRVVPESGDPTELRGLNVRITIPISSTDGEVLTVPLAALSSSADGTARVQVEREPGVVETVEVNVGLATAGSVEVSAVSGVLAAGDLVVVGRDAPEGSNAGGETSEGVPPPETTKVDDEGG